MNRLTRLWPQATAALIVLVAWELLALSGWRPDYVLPGPIPVFQELGRELGTIDLYKAIGITMGRAALGYAIAIAIGLLIGIAVTRFRLLRRAIGSLITGIQTMPSIAWFPLAILFFQLSEAAILFVVVLGAAPSIANGIISGIDEVSPELVRAGRVLGAKGLRLYRTVILPASLPSVIAGLKQGWAFAWRSLMAGELLGVVAGRPSIGAKLQFAREFSDARALLATMIVILVIGIVVDGFFNALSRRVRGQRGLVGVAA